jgi:hypothetical protein
MQHNPYQSLRHIPAQRNNAFYIVGLLFSVAVWLFLGAMMWLQYHDEAAHYMPRFVMNGWGFSVVMVGFTGSCVYLWRVVSGADTFGRSEG